MGIEIWCRRALELTLLVAAGLGSYLLVQLALGTRPADFYTQNSG